MIKFTKICIYNYIYIPLSLFYLICGSWLSSIDYPIMTTVYLFLSEIQQPKKDPSLWRPNLAGVLEETANGVLGGGTATLW